MKIDRDQNLWAAADQGISKLPRTSLDFYNVDVTDARIESTVYEAAV